MGECEKGPAACPVRVFPENEQGLRVGAMQGKTGFPTGFAGWFRGFGLFLPMRIPLESDLIPTKLAEANFIRFSV